MPTERVWKACPKLTDRHIAPNPFQKMNVRLATQVLSHSCSSAVRSAASLNQFSESLKEKAIPTAVLLEKMDNLFDCLNSKVRYDNRKIYRSALTAGCRSSEFLKEVRVYISNTKSPAKVSCLNGIVQTINATLALANDLFKSDLEVSYFLTHKINQDSLENFFSQIRGRGGFNRHPSLSEFNNVIGRIMSMKLLSYASNMTNCENDDEEFVRHAVSQEMDIIQEIDTQNTAESLTVSIDSESGVRSSSSSSETNTAAITLQTASKRYFSGYVAFKHLKRFPCSNCADTFVMKDDEGEPYKISSDSELLIFHKNYFNSSDFGGLHPPSDSFFQVCSIHISTFAIFLQTAQKKITSNQK